MGLREYNRKRDFKRTAEPRGKRVDAEEHQFVIQKHDATRLHYDFRLELDGVLKSWAVPKGPSLDPAQKRLAVEVEDHPVDYADFEGSIPEGEYGAGNVIVWDKGSWRPIGDARRALREGRIEFELHGKKLHGSWILVRTRGDAAKPHWLLIKRNDRWAKALDEYDVVADESKSVVTGRELEARKRAPKKAARRRASAGGFPDFIEPQLAQLAEAPPVGDKWVHEVKFDGYRTAARIRGDEVRLLTRSNLDWTAKYPSLAAALSKLGVESAYLDGEIVVLDEKGRSDFQLLQNALKNAKAPFAYYLFDLLELNGEDLRPRPLVERKELLKRLLAASGSKQLIYSEHWPVPGEKVLGECCKLGLEGVVSKDAGAPHQPGRGGGWIKSKCTAGQELVIGGYSPPQGSRHGFGALLLGAYDAQGQLTYVGRVGTGFKGATIRDLMRRFEPLKIEKSPFDRRVPNTKGVTWLKPKLVAEVEMRGWTQDNIVRQAAFKGLRLDKPARDVMQDQALPEPKRASEPIERLHLTHPDKVLLPSLGLTKRDMVEYYAAVADWMLPHLVDRPLSLLRCPDGARKECFFQKNLGEAVVPALYTQKITQREGKPGAKTEELLYLDSLAGLFSLVQLGVVEIHAWGTHRDHFMNPDLMVFDLDPGPGVEWKDLVRGARLVRSTLEKLALKSFVKVSGSKGLHIHVPLEPVHAWDEVKEYARTVARYLAEQEPDRYVATASKKEREGRIFIDYLRNGYGATSVAPFSLRAKERGGVALPVDWSALDRIEPNEFSVEKTIRALRRRKKDPWEGYFDLKQRLNLSTLEVRRGIG